MCITFFGQCTISSDEIIVKDKSELIKAISSAVPGNTIILKNGVWTDIEIVFEASGTEEKPISLKAETSGKVFIEGLSNLKLAGQYLAVQGLVFRNGYTPVSEVISYRKNKENVCNHCRVTSCVVDNFNNPERYDEDLWVAIYGKNNRFDHNNLTGKRNQGVTLAVRLDTEASRDNNHQIDHNYFGPRPILGSNGGETIRIGTSHFSLTNSKTIVEDNYFDRCNGEHEIISNKSCQNTFRNNTFYECQGTLTMRHGNETLVENNFFFGNGKPNTGGIRIINEKQTVQNNYCEGLTGYRLRGALVIMNGVPNSPPNRYSPVIESVASNNTFVDCDYIQFCAGSDDERSAPPTSTTVANNIFYNSNKSDIFTIFDDVSGIAFNGNYLGSNIIPFQTNGFTKNDSCLAKKGNIWVPKDGISAGAVLPNAESMPTKENTGASFYPKHEEDIYFQTGKISTLSANDGDLYEAIKSAQSGDIIILSPGDYTIPKSIDIRVPITVKGSSEKSDVTIYFERSSLFNIENGGSLELQNLTISGKESPDRSGNSVIRSSRYSMINNYKLLIDNCVFKDLKINNSFNVLDVYKNTFADSIFATNCVFQDISGSVFTLDKEYEDLGIYNVETLVIENCIFENIQGAAINLYRGGGDESTFGPMLQIANSSFNNIGLGKKNKADASVKIHGVQYGYFKDNTFEKSKSFDMFLTVGDPVITFENTTFKDSDDIKSNTSKFRIIPKTKSK